MNPTTSEEEAAYPTPWRMFDSVVRIECRQLSDDTYELRSLTHTLVVTKEAFDLYRSEGELFSQWMYRHGVKAIPRADV